MPNVSATQLAPTSGPPLKFREWPGQIVPPFEVHPSAEVDAKQGPGSGRPSWIIADQKLRHIAGLFLDPGVAECWRQAFTVVYEAGRQAGVKEIS